MQHAGVDVGRSEDVIKSIWLRLRRQPQLLDNFELLLRRLTSQLHRSHLDYYALQKTFRTYAESSLEIIRVIYIGMWEWVGSRVVSVLDSGAEGPGFKLQSRRCRLTVLGKLSHPSCFCSASSEIGSSPLKGCEGNCRHGGK